MTHRPASAGSLRLAILAVALYAIAVHALLAGFVQGAMAAGLPDTLCLVGGANPDPIPTGRHDCCDTLCKSLCAGGAAALPPPSAEARRAGPAVALRAPTPARQDGAAFGPGLPRPRGPPAAA
ncbi:hypothetical protein [Oceanicella sp. SM1341]|uniref:hypothetical protein n=1 Tax=Oceanicella sp. SM1341 TaxID=1548889 RepID=UPI000E4E895B|nr:hypothetical protein [Oceanicella sp. SM1341]